MIFSEDNGFRVELGLGYNAAGLNRMNARFRVFMEPFQKEFAGSKVLDLASHDGRWSWAALRLGADRVTGVEARPELVAKGSHLFADSALKGRAEFLVGDIFDVLPELKKQGRSYDVILCLGIFYHVMDHNRLLRLIQAFNPRLVILDTGLINDNKPYIQLGLEDTHNFLNAIAAKRGQQKNIVGVVSRGGLKLMCDSLGFSCEFLKWDASKIDNRQSLHDYLTENPGRRQRYSVIMRPLKR